MAVDAVAEGIGTLGAAFEVFPGLGGQCLDVLLRVAGCAHGADCFEHEPEGLVLRCHNHSLHTIAALRVERPLLR